MLISIKRHYLEANIDVDILINTNYIIRIEPTAEGDKPNTRIVYDSTLRDEISIMYTNESVSSIKGKLTKARNKKQEQESD